jgi:hypothetical protein
MGDERQTGSRVPQEQSLSSNRKSVLQSTAERFGRTAQVKLEKIDNEYRRERVIGQQLVGEFKAAEAEAQLQHDRLENIEEEKATQRQAVRTRRLELDTQGKQATAAADDIIGEHTRSKEENAAGEAEARNRRLKAEIEEKKLREKLDSMDSTVDPEGQRKRLVEMETAERVKLVEIDEELQGLLMNDGDQSALLKRTKQAERVGITQRLDAISTRILEMDGLL